jgi:hypothetical protein
MTTTVEKLPFIIECFLYEASILDGKPYSDATHSSKVLVFLQKLTGSLNEEGVGNLWVIESRWFFGDSAVARLFEIYRNKTCMLRLQIGVIDGENAMSTNGVTIETFERSEP